MSALLAPAVADRVRRMEDQASSPATAVVDRARLGQAIAFVCLRTTPEHYPAVRRLAGSCRDIVECRHHLVRRDDAFILKVAAASSGGDRHPDHPPRTLGATSTAIVLSTLVADCP
ncbi:MAG: Lrp/AsnC family transcriptional regulator [Rhodospirillaceae bacterium]|nr:Lrp/AsnC family transcriptional regulator [Rhodospirillaceae bacterium]